MSAKAGQVDALRPNEAPIKILANPTKYTGTTGLAQRAEIRKQFSTIGHVIAGIDTSTRNGRPGQEGDPGDEGAPGDTGHHGFDGSAGQPGHHGTHGQHAEDVRIAIRGTPDSLLISGINGITLERTMALEDNAFILIDAKGGDGGRGGDGGPGGRGGRGGAGMNGRQGGRGTDATQKGQTGGDGGDGAHGGPGGDGGRGGDGGNSGDGGNAGHGGNVHVAVDQRELALLWLFELDARRGEAGSAGNPGRGGAGGVGGLGGEGGAGGPGGNGGPGGMSGDGYIYAGPPGRRGRDGNRGSNGHEGQSGISGMRGHDGFEGRNGRIYFHIYNDGQHTNTISDRFEAGTITYEIHDDNDDGIFEPGSEFIIDNFEWTNTGELEMPAGAIATIRADEPTVSAGITYACPRVLPGQRFKVPERFRARIADAQPSCNSNYQSTASLTSEVSLLKRPFPESMVKTPPITIQWPMRIADVRVADWLGPGETCQVQVVLENISRRPYGGPKDQVIEESKEPGSTHDDSAGTVAVKLTVDPLLEVIPSAVPGSNYVIEDGGLSATFHIPKVSPKSTHTIEFTVRMTIDAGRKLFTHPPWRVDLVLRKRCVCYYSGGIRVTPRFQPNILSDILLVTSNELDRTEFLAWSYLCQMLGCSVNFWDLQRYNGLSADDADWTRAARLLIFPCFKEQTASKTFSLHHLRFADFARHMSAQPDDQGALFLGITHECFGPGLSGLNALLYDYSDVIRGQLGTSATINGRGGAKEFASMRAPRMASGGTHAQDSLRNPGDGRGVTNFPAISNVLDEVYPSDQKTNLQLWYADECACTCCGCDVCTDSPLVRMDRYRKRFENADLARRYLVQYQGKHERVLCWARTPSMCVNPCVYRRGAPIATLAETKLTSGWLPYHFDGTYFQANEEIWQDGPFMQTFLTILHLLPIEQRLALNTLPHVSRLQFAMADLGVVPFALCTVASLARSVATEISAGDIRVPAASRMYHVLNLNIPTYGPLAHLMIAALSAPPQDELSRLYKGHEMVASALTCVRSIRDKIYDIVKVGHHPLCKQPIDVYIASGLNMGTVKLLNRIDPPAKKFLRYLTQRMYMPCEDDAFDTYLAADIDTNVPASVQEYDDVLRQWQAQSWTAFETEDARRFAKAHAEAEAAAAAAATEYYKRMASPPPPPTYYEVTESVLPSPPSFQDAATLSMYQQSWDAYYAAASQHQQSIDYYQGVFSGHAAAPIHLNVQELANYALQNVTNVNTESGATPSNH